MQLIKKVTDEASQIINQHLSKLVIVILQKKVEANTGNHNCLITDLELILTLKYRYINHHRGQR